MNLPRRKLMANCLLVMPLTNDIITSTNIPEAALQSEDMSWFDFQRLLSLYQRHTRCWMGQGFVMAERSHAVINIALQWGGGEAQQPRYLWAAFALSNGLSGRLSQTLSPWSGSSFSPRGRHRFTQKCDWCRGSGITVWVTQWKTGICPITTSISPREQKREITAVWAKPAPSFILSTLVFHSQRPPDGNTLIINDEPFNGNNPTVTQSTGNIPYCWHTLLVK